MVAVLLGWGEGAGPLAFHACRGGFRILCCDIFPAWCLGWRFGFGCAISEPSCLTFNGYGKVCFLVSGFSQIFYNCLNVN